MIEALSAAGALLLAGAAWVGHLLGRRSERDKVAVEGSKVSLEEFQVFVAAQTAENARLFDQLTAARKDLLDAGNALNSARRDMLDAREAELEAEHYIALLSAHIEAGNPPPPPARPKGRHREDSK